MAATFPRALLALALALACALPRAAELGTLFHSPEERARLDQLRRGEPIESAAGGPAAPRDITGYVQRSDGRHTVWIDGVPVQVSTPRARRLLDPRSVRGNGARGEDVKVERKPAR